MSLKYRRSTSRFSLQEDIGRHRLRHVWAMTIPVVVKVSYTCSQALPLDLYDGCRYRSVKYDWARVAQQSCSVGWLCYRAGRPAVVCDCSNQPNRLVSGPKTLCLNGKHRRQSSSCSWRKGRCQQSAPPVSSNTWILAAFYQYSYWAWCSVPIENATESAEFTPTANSGIDSRTW